MAPSFHTADRQTYRRVVVVGVLLSVAFMTVSLSLRPPSGETPTLVRADHLIRTADDQQPANWSAFRQRVAGSGDENPSKDQTGAGIASRIALR